MLIAQVMIKNGIPTTHSSTLIILIMNIAIGEASGEGVLYYGGCHLYH